MKRAEIIYHLKKAKSLTEAANLILGIKTKNKRCYFKSISERFAKQYAFTYDFYFKKRISSYDYLIDLFLNKTSFKKDPGSILDIGCGSALFLIRLKEKIAKNFPNIKLYGIDQSKIMIKLAKKNIQENKLSDQIKVIEGKAENLKKLLLKYKIQPKYIVSTSTLHLIKDPNFC